ncbi:MAG: hypothetical protein ABIV06_08225 [Thermoanaerobaculia bacterium]
MRTAPSRLGELLEKRGHLTREQLLRALRNQKVLGSRLGSCLLEIEALTEEQLCAALAEQSGMPCASPEDLRGIPDDVLELIPAKVAKRCQAIAFRASSTQVKVALIDARNLSLQDEIAFVVGKRIRWHVAPELRMLEALEKHYGEECPARFVKLLDKMNRSRFLWARESAGARDAPAEQAGDQLQWDTQIAGVPASASGAESSPDSQASISVELPHFQHAALDLPTLKSAPAAPAAHAPDPGAPAPAPAVPVPATAAAAPEKPPAKALRPPKPEATLVPVPPAPSPAPVVAAPPPPPPPPMPATPAMAPSPAALRRSVEETEQRLLQPKERDDVGRALLDFAAGRVLRAALFVVRKEEVSAWFWAGAGLDEMRLAALRLSLKQPSLFDGLREKGGSFRGALSQLPAHRTLAACFSAPPLAEEVLVLPVRVKERLVAALLLEPRLAAAPGLSPADLADLQRVIAKAEIAFEVCIMQSKLRRA